MTENTAYNITFENQDIVIKLNKTMIKYEKLATFLDYLFLETTRQQSSLTPEAVVNLSDEVDNAVWLNVKSKLQR
ncbi:MAG: hypothetical protein HC836_06280 [Richelia sp. RM2_1_2]|nr:hypothetical protein [Rivularia sp. T60_A2020_040]NJL81215.1 hypothetical protein [Richelia sp. SM2_1_7]NJM19367.1 hypothetical protein [Richelia sp. SM1_7_0]NJN10169.1 hypothetical protein [Richelia sp. RM1_1_1]NJO31216.1 hypothetical protein [Richelia sp. SL_2_1]NJO57972.1 hypothetical protein [Richelia sp. RM2_1_2]